MNPKALDAQLLQLVNALTDAVIFSVGDRLVGFNDPACVLFGYSREEMATLPRAALVPPGDTSVARANEQRKATGSFRGEVSMLKRGGVRFEASVTGVTLVAADGTEIACAVVHDLADRQRADQATAALQMSNELLHALSDAAFEGVLIHHQGVILVANRAAEQMARVESGGLQGKKLFDFIAPEAIPTVMARVAQNDEQPYRAFGRRSDGSIYPVEAQGRSAPVPVQGSAARVVAIRDISDRVALEEQFHQAQKMEAVGRLAGGVAHDFNNLLSVIMGATSLAADALPPGHPGAAELEQVLRAAESAAELTRQLLAFSRKQVLQPRVIELDRTIGRVESMIRRLVGEDVQLKVRLNAAGALIKADPGQIENVVMNLTVNARDSMPKGGTLTISTSLVALDPEWARTHLDTRPGPHVRLTITDTGVGMDAATRARVFEPFFTTKGPGRGTGLGLSTVFGIVKQAGGFVWVDSEPGRGATFTIDLPVTTEPPAAATGEATTAATPLAPSTILLVEDEPQLLNVTAIVLRQAGYVVLEAPSGKAALELSAGHQGVIHLLISDLVMPGINGTLVAESLVAQRPDLRVLLMSGYTEHDVAGRHFLPKPFAPSALLAKVQAVLA